jgi:hypothetical protein
MAQAGLYELDTAEVTARFRLAYDGAIRRSDLCERCGKASYHATGKNLLASAIKKEDASRT